MKYVDPDRPNEKLIAELVRMYEASAERLRAIVLNPPGANGTAQMYQGARAASLLAQVQAEIDRIKREATHWTSRALQDAMARGLEVARKQVEDAGLPVRPTQSSVLSPQSFTQLNTRSIELLARDTVGDLVKAANAMGSTATTALRKIGAAGISKADVNRIIGGGIIEGTPQQTVRELRDLLQKVHGDQVTVPTRSGGTMTFDVKYYANMVAQTQTREVQVKARHAQLADLGLDLVTIVGRVSLNPCTMLLGKVFSLSGKSTKYPPFSSVSQGQLPYKLFHPHCTKSTAPFIEGLSKERTPLQVKGRAA